MSGYLHFNGTGNAAIDALMQVIEDAGDAYHHTEYWQDQEDGQPSWVEKIQAAADAAAKALNPK